MAEQVITQEARAATANSGSTVLTANAPEFLFEDANPERERFIISAGVADVWLDYTGSVAEVGKGHCVRAGGPPFEERAFKGAVSVISNGAATIGWTETLYEGAADTGAGELEPGWDQPATGPSDNTQGTASLPVTGE